jgi:hypothetical protein
MDDVERHEHEGPAMIAGPCSLRTDLMLSSHQHATPAKRSTILE